ncbi:MAG: BirA family transcriptional regulator [Solirubrobacteraceae bacterium]|jgi:BirA family biotin operon repressor/biotin-[acetyl-CoA-carboxylase] ligase|nr:BirA family transcriptional regulator [Solirubrobacteraceae bacterium]
MIGLPRVHHRRTGSTNARARDLAAAGAPHGTVVTASEQTAGRGRQGRTWTAPPGRALLMSVLLRDWPRLLPLAAGVAVAEVAGPSAMVKWPNDVQLKGRKVAGILVEGRPQEGWMVLGIGLNVAVERDDFPEELRESAATMERSAADVEPVLEEVLDRLSAWLSTPHEDLLEAFRARDALFGRDVAWTNGEGVAEGIDAQGRLLVRTSAGIEALDAGEVHLRPR